MPPHLTPARFVTCAVMAASALAAGCSSSTDQIWTLQQARNLGSFDALPRLARAADGTLAVQPQDKDPAAAMAAQAGARTAADAMAWTSAQAWSAGNVLLIYALPGQRGMPGGLAVFTDRRGNYQFIALGQPFDSAPVMDDAQDDADGARPGLVYAAH